VLSEIAVESRYLYFPVKNDAPKRHVRLLAGGEVVRAFEIELAESEPDFWVSADLGVFIGQRLALEVDGLEPDASLLGVLCQSNVPAGTEEEYNEPLRPQFHFSSRRGWNNDPNGLLYYDGEYHLFYQHNPYGRRWGNMHWGHAISTDLVHWQELGDALYPDRLGTCFSGSGVVDWGDTAGLEAGAAKTLVCIFTSAGDTSVESQGQPFTQSIAYSNDRGRTWRMYPGNPVLGHVAARNRDPKVIWHAPTSRWVMALYLKVRASARISFRFPWTATHRTRGGCSGGQTAPMSWGSLTGRRSGKRARCCATTGEATAMPLRRGATSPRRTGGGFRSRGCASSCRACRSISR